MKQVQVYEYDGKLFRTEDEVEVYKKSMMEESIEECIYEDEYSGSESISVKDLRRLLNTFGTDKIYDYLEDRQN